MTTIDFDGRPVLAVFTKAHPITQAAARGTPAPDLNDGDVRRNPGEPSREQADADRYKKPVMKWNGLTIRIENPAGSVRRGKNRAGGTWEVRMKYDYGEISGSEGVDGDKVDVFVGPNLEAPMVYVVHQRQYGNWTEYDEDKCMIGFDSQEDAVAAFLTNYSDPRFLGPVTAMPVEEFKAKVRATKKKPAMIKSMVVFVKAQPTPAAGDRIEFLSDRHTDKGPSAGEITGTKVTADGLYVRIRHSDEERLFSWEDLRSNATKKGDTWLIKAHVRAHTRRTSSGKVVTVGPYDTRVQKRGEAPGQLDMFAGGEKKAPDAGKRTKFYVTMVRDGKKKPAFLAGPFDTHDEALAQVDSARKKAYEVDPWSEFDAFGTTGLTADRHPPGVLNGHLGVGNKSGEKLDDCSKKINNGGASKINNKGGAKVAKQYPEKQPTEIMRWRPSDWPKKFQPREPREGEIVAALRRSQRAPEFPGGPGRGFVVYEKGDVITAGLDTPHVVEQAKPALKARVGHMTYWAQFVVLRPATDADLKAVESQRKELEAEHHRAMSRMMSS